VKIKLDRTLCDGFGICAKYAPEHFSLDDWGYASLAGSPVIAPTDEPAVTRALLDCPVHPVRSHRSGRQPGRHTDRITGCSRTR
jgi:ferredoxin